MASFETVADDYDAARPSYPPGVFEALGRLDGQLVVEVGAGTGIATRQLLGHGASVVAVDRGPEVLRRAASQTPGLPAVLSDGAVLPIRAGTADLICFAQAWHWLDDPARIAEAHRVLRPEGRWAGWWNHARADESEWFNSYWAMIERSCPGTHRDQRDIDWGATLQSGGHFTVGDRIVVPWLRLLVVGMDEADNVAFQLTPIPPDDRRPDYTLWYDQTVAANISPPVPAHRRSLEVPGTDGSLFLVAVPPSLLQPHAARSNDSLYYPVRTGTTRVPLSELEVADRYRRRIESMANVQSRVESIHAEGIAELVDEDHFNDNYVPVWVSVSAVPDVAGPIRMRRGLSDDWRDWLIERHLETPSYRSTELGYRHPALQPQFESLRLRSTLDSSLQDTRCTLHLDGSGFFAESFDMSLVKTEERYVGEDDSPQGVVVTRWLVVMQLFTAMWILAAHAARCGGFGSLNVRMQVLSARPDGGLLALKHSFLGRPTA